MFKKVLICICLCGNGSHDISFIKTFLLWRTRFVIQRAPVFLKGFYRNLMNKSLLTKFLFLFCWVVGSGAVVLQCYGYVRDLRTDNSWRYFVAAAQKRSFHLFSSFFEEVLLPYFPSKIWRLNYALLLFVLNKSYMVTVLTFHKSYSVVQLFLCHSSLNNSKPSLA